jgi:hypothetical protein
MAVFCELSPFALELNPKAALLELLPIAEAFSPQALLAPYPPFPPTVALLYGPP